MFKLDVFVDADMDKYGNMLCAVNGVEELTLYNLTHLQFLREFIFPTVYVYHHILTLSYLLVICGRRLVKMKDFHFLIWWIKRNVHFSLLFLKQRYATFTQDTSSQVTILLWCTGFCLRLAPALHLRNCYRPGICIYNSGVAPKLWGGLQIAQNANF